MCNFMGLLPPLYLHKMYCMALLCTDKKIHKVKRTSSQVKDKFLSFRFQLSFPSVLFNIECEYMPGRLLIRIMLLKFVMFFQFAIVALFSIKYFQLCNKSPINQDCSGPYQENVGSLSFFVQTQLHSAHTLKTSGQYSLVPPLRLVNKI